MSSLCTPARRPLKDTVIGLVGFILASLAIAGVVAAAVAFGAVELGYWIYSHFHQVNTWGYGYNPLEYGLLAGVLALETAFLGFTRETRWRSGAARAAMVYGVVVFCTGVIIDVHHQQLPILTPAASWFMWLGVLFLAEGAWCVRKANLARRTLPD